MLQQVKKDYLFVVNTDFYLKNLRHLVSTCYVADASTNLFYVALPVKFFQWQVTIGFFPGLGIQPLEQYFVISKKVETFQKK